jgi:manganese/zinc/iron transport system permease protein
LGHVGALVIPAWFGYGSTTTAGMMAVAAGCIFVLAALFGPRHGVLVKEFRQRVLTWRILSEDILALLYRIEERGDQQPPSRSDLQRTLLSGRSSTGLLLAWHRLLGRIDLAEGGFRLLDSGKRLAQELVRSHRLWEQYLVSQAGVSAERIHDQAEKLEHFTNREFRERLDAETAAPQVDPHGRPIPPEDAGLRKR